MRSVSVTPGRDGTLIRASRDQSGLELPMMGINMGHLGYLTQVSGEEFMDPVLDALLNDSFTLEKRMMLEGSVVGSAENGKGHCLK
ncbi:MAG: NAD(+)/NADH kinase [Clostridium sp.]